ncbi:MAG TPA: toast rack family protein [Methanoregula sp.]|nr:toast rack family protein [Methanoregula sp.]
MTRIILWLVAIMVVSLVLGFGIQALSGGYSPGSEHTLSPFRQNALLMPNTTSIPLDGATAGDISLTLGAGELEVDGGVPDQALMEATVFSRDAVWQPDLGLSLNNSRKSVTITEKGHKGKEWFAVDSPNRWKIHISEKVPVRLDVNVGGGDMKLNLGMLNLETLAVHTGAGDTTIDLSGYRGGRFDATIKNGVGDLTLRIPRDSNMRIRAHGGIGDITHDGFIKDGETYVSPGFNSSQAVSEITLNQGVGSIILKTE